MTDTLETVARGLVLLSGIYCLALGTLALIQPDRARQFLLGFASSARAHYLEMMLRLLVGGSLVIVAPSTPHATVFETFGWIILVTTVGLILLPWRWHQRFAQQTVPPFLKHLWVIGLGALALGAYLVWGTALAKDPATQHGQAIGQVLEADHQLGSARNRASETTPLAEAVTAYVEGLDALDLSRCPDDFRAALRRHRNAWDDAVPFFAQFPELRGELHDVFEMIRSRDERTRKGLEQVEARIWNTWREVEDAASHYRPSQS